MRYIMIIILALSILPVKANNSLPLPQFGFDTGTATLDSGRFKSSDIWSVDMGLSLSDWNLNYFYEDMGAFYTEAGDGSVSVKGRGSRLSYTVYLGDRFIIQPGIGLYYWHAVAELYSVNIGEDSGTSPMLQLNAHINLLDTFSIGINFRQYAEVSGQRIDFMGIGLRLGWQ